MRRGKVILDRGYGLSDLENGVPARPESVFSIASVTRNFTAVAVLQLVESGAVSLDDDIAKFLPDFPQKNRGVTVRRLLDHTAGVHNITAIPAYWSQVGEPIEPSKLIAFFGDAPLDFEPGTSYAYSNSGYILLGAIVEKVSGVSYGHVHSSAATVPTSSRSTTTVCWSRTTGSRDSVRRASGEPLR